MTMKVKQDSGSESAHTPVHTRSHWTAEAKDQRDSWRHLLVADRTDVLCLPDFVHDTQDSPTPVSSF